MSFTVSLIQIGQVGVLPQKVALFSTDILSKVTTAGYIQQNFNGITFSPDTIVEAIYAANAQTGVGTFGIFTCSISNGAVTLSEWVNPGNVDLPVTPGHLAVYVSSDGQIGQNASPAINLGAIQAGASGTAGTLASYPATASTGSFIIKGVANSGNTNTTLSNASMGQASVLSITDPGAATANIVPVSSAIAVPAGVTNSLVILKNQQATHTALASAGHVNVFTASGSDQYQILDIFVNGGGINFSGGSGDRLLALTDGTTVFTVIPAASLQTLVNTRWGVTGVPYPASAAINALTVAGANLYLQYSGGTLDYSAGALIVTVILCKVA